MKNTLNTIKIKINVWTAHATRILGIILKILKYEIVYLTLIIAMHQSKN